MCSDTEAPPHRINVIIAVVAIVATVVGSCIGAYLTNQGSTDQWNRQISFDKRTAAEQLYTDVGFLDLKLQYDSSAYTQNLDLSKTGSQWPDNVININHNSTTWLVVDDVDNTAIAPYLIKISGDTYAVKRLETSGLARTRSPFSNVGMTAVPPVLLPDPKNTIYSTLSYPIMPVQLYNDHGTYYVYQTHMGKFNADLSQRLYLLYYTVAQAEAERQYVQNFIDSHPNTPLTRQYFDAYMQMRADIIDASQMTDVILGELKTEM